MTDPSATAREAARRLDRASCPHTTPTKASLPPCSECLLDRIARALDAFAAARVQAQERDGRFLSSLTADQWQRIDQVRELVKQEGDRRCEAAFDDLSAEIVALRNLAAARVAEERESIMGWLVHRCDYGPPCDRCTYCSVRRWIALRATSGGER